MLLRTGGSSEARSADQLSGCCSPKRLVTSGPASSLERNVDGQPLLVDAESGSERLGSLVPARPPKSSHQRAVRLVAPSGHEHTPVTERRGQLLFVSRRSSRGASGLATSGSRRLPAPDECSPVNTMARTGAGHGLEQVAHSPPRTIVVPRACFGPDAVESGHLVG